MLKSLKYMVAAISLLAGWSCEKTDSRMEGGASPREIYITFPGEATREATRGENLKLEEGKVNRLLYAIFDRHLCVVHKVVDLSGEDYHTGGNPYKLANVDQEALDVDSEIFVIANPPRELEQSLMAGIEDPANAEAKYQEWRTCAYSSDLNAEAAGADSRAIDSPVMAGYVKLKNDTGTVVFVPVEHVYCRVWYYFEWRNMPSTQGVTVDRIEISGLRNKTYMFDIKELKDTDPFPESEASAAIVNEDPVQQPFFGRLSVNSPGDQYHLGDTPRMYISYDRKDFYNIVCRYTLANGVMQTQSRPYRYYSYSYERVGRILEDDPLIKVSYHFRQGGPRTGEPGEVVVHKVATARLYDETYFPGKRHHGMLRNYTYRLRCIVNTMTNVMDVQVSSHPWYKVTVDDIPPFE